MTVSAAVDRRRAALALLSITVAYNALEGAVAAWSGIAAGSLALLAFGGDSAIEIAAALAVTWRFSVPDGPAAARAEERALRVIGATFLLLAAAVIAESCLSLAGRAAAETSVPGIALAAVSFATMPALSLAKTWTAARGNLPALAAEARETLACWFLSVTLFAGLLANALAGWWWLDAATALALTPWLIREGLDDLRGEPEKDRPCFCRTCLFGFRDCQPPDGCEPACC